MDEQGAKPRNQPAARTQHFAQAFCSLRRMLAPVALATVFGGFEANAFTQADHLGSLGTTVERLDDCWVDLTVDSRRDPLGNVVQSASVFVRERVDQPRIYAGGSAFIEGARQTGLPRIDENLISRCAQVAPNEVIDLVQDGADGTFGSETRISFSFTIARQVPPRRPIRPPALADGRYTYEVIGSANTGPAAQAGPDQTVGPGDRVILSGAGTDPDGDSLAFRWSQVSGPAVSLSNPGGPTTSFTAPAVASGPGGDTLVFELTASDGVGGTASDRVDVQLRSDTAGVPVVDAGPDRTVVSGRTVRLDASATDPDPGDGLTLRWTQVDGPPVTLDGPTTETPSFVAPTLAAGDPATVLRFDLRATDTGGNTASDTIAITVEPPPTTANPVVDAGPDRSVASGSTVRLDASATDPDPGDSLTLRWTQVDGLPVTLDGPTTATPSFVAPTLTTEDPAAVFRFDLQATDTGGNTASDTVAIKVEPPREQTTPDRVAVALSGAPSRLADVVPFDLTITFGRAVLGFDLRDIRVDGGRVVSLSGTGGTYTATLAPDGPGTMRVRVPPNVARDAGGRPNGQSNRVEIFVSGAAVTQRSILKFMEGRVHAVAKSQPRLFDILQSTTPNIDIAADARGLRFELATRGNATVWTYTTGYQSRGSTDFDYAHAVLGATLVRGKDLMAGAMLQYDTARLVDGSVSVRGKGWLIGPYIFVQSADRSSAFEASALVGRTRNSVNSFDSGAETFSGQRSALHLTYTGVLETGNVQWLPSLSLTHVAERTDPYVSRLREPIPGQKVTLTEFIAEGRARISFPDARLTVSPGAEFGIDALRRSGGRADYGSLYGVSVSADWRPTPGVTLSGSISSRTTSSTSSGSTAVSFGARFTF